MTTPTLLQNLIDRLRSLDAPTYRAVVGFDGYVDKIQNVVRAKTPTGNAYFDSITGLADLLYTLAGKSGQVELVTQETKIGGNAPILAQALASLGVPNRCVGMLSDPLFGQMHPDCDRVSLGPPAETNALEFGDGKIILSEVSTFEQLHWANYVAQIGLDTIRQHYAESQLLAFVDWANLPHGNELWRAYLTEVVEPAGTRPADEKHFFFDLCDPTKRSAGAVRDALRIVTDYVPFGAVTLGMNENEARRIYLALNDDSPADAVKLAQTPDLLRVALFIQEQTTIPTVLIHPTDRSLVATAGGVLEMTGRLVPQPKVLTGGGDNLNAGFGWGLLHGFELPDCLLLGMATAGAYIETGQSPTRADLTAYLENWRTALTSP